MKIGEVIRRRRKALQLTLEQVALAAETDAGNLSRVERGMQSPSYEAVDQIAKALGTTASALFAEMDTVKEPSPTYSREFLRLHKAFEALSPEDQGLTLQFMKWLRTQRQKRQ